VYGAGAAETTAAASASAGTRRSTSAAEGAPQQPRSAPRIVSRLHIFPGFVVQMIDIERDDNDDEQQQQ